jgi:diaminopimelate epimerase
MLKFQKAHAYGNDFLYVRRDDVRGVQAIALAREMCHRQTGVGADGLIVYEPAAIGGAPYAAAMTVINADGSVAEVSGNGVRGLAALLLRDVEEGPAVEVTIETAAGVKQLTRTERRAQTHTFRAAMGLPRDLAQETLRVDGEAVDVVVMNFGNPQCIVLGPMPPDERFRRIGAGLERHARFPQQTNVEFAEVEAPGAVRIRIWERGVGPTLSSGTGSCASLVAAAAYGGSARDAVVTAPGGPQRVEWREDSVYLTGWAEIVCDGAWLRALPT